MLGLDVGDRRVGVAVSDPLGTTAQPLETVDRDSALARLGELVVELEVSRLVVGLPFNMDGSEGGQAASVRAFADELQETLDLPVTFVDERLTTRQADAALAGAKIGREEKKGASDRVAAALILRQYLERKPEE